MYGATVNSEGSRVEIGECTIICENAVLRASAITDVDRPVIVGHHVFISPHATLIGCTIEPCSYIATGATILQGAVVKTGAAVAVGAFVHAGTVIPSKFFVPPNFIAVGDPVKLYSPAEKDKLVEAIKSVGFAKLAFGAAADWEDRIERYREATERRSEEFDSHCDDLILETGAR
jgi:carbonic anhydrase/acetyltransferase-like protein (isoleucine patch superfamily)